METIEKKLRCVCNKCNSTDILFDAYVIWNEEDQIHEIHSTFNDCYCNVCQGGTKVKEIEL